MNTQVRISPKRNDLKQVINKHGDLLDVHQFNDHALNAHSKGPWLLSSPQGTESGQEASRWVHVNMDLKFDVRFEV